jgi:hypothetical protein
MGVNVMDVPRETSFRGGALAAAAPAVIARALRRG